jgi:hypothetical protein
MRVCFAHCCSVLCCAAAGASNKRLQGAGDELAGQKSLFKETHKQQRTLQKQSWLDRWDTHDCLFVMTCIGPCIKRKEGGACASTVCDCTRKQQPHPCLLSLGKADDHSLGNHVQYPKSKQALSIRVDGL